MKIMIFNFKPMGTFSPWIFIVTGVILIVIIGGIVTQHYVFTPSFKNSRGKTIPGSIAEFRRIKLGGYFQAVLIRGKNINNPVLLYLHAGPGLSETGMFRNRNAILEDYYTMVYLDQRGGGKSYSPFLDFNTLNTEQLLQDIHELTLYLKQRFGQNKIIIMGHSFGAGFGALAAATFPEDYIAFVGIGQPVNPCEADRLSYAWTLDQAKKSANTKAIDELKPIDEYWRLKEPKGYFKGMMVNKKYVGYYGGQIKGEKSFLPYVLKNSLCNEFTIFDYAPYLLGMLSSGKASWKIMITTDLRKQASVFKCPFILLTGRHDYNVVPLLVEEYFNIVKAPVKKQYWFEKSAHFPHFEESELFQKIMIEEILPMVKDSGITKQD